MPRDVDNAADRTYHPNRIDRSLPRINANERNSTAPRPHCTHTHPSIAVFHRFVTPPRLENQLRITYREPTSQRWQQDIAKTLQTIVCCKSFEDIHSTTTRLIPRSVCACLARSCKEETQKNTNHKKAPTKTIEWVHTTPSHKARCQSTVCASEAIERVQSSNGTQ